MTSTSSFPASGVQERIWLAERMEPGEALYNVPMAWRVDGRLDASTLRRALAEVVRRHEILRTAFTQRDGRLYQVVGEPWAPEVQRPEFGGTSSAERRREVDAWLREEARRDFDPASGRLLRAGLLDLGEDAQVLFVCVHHLVWDAASTALFLAELRTCYTDATEARTSTGPRPDGEHEAAPHQERIAFIDRFEKGVVYESAPVYHNLTLVLRMPYRPDPGRLRAAVTAAEMRHEALRTNLVFIDDVVVQRVASEPRVTVPEVEETPSAVRDFAAEPLDLAVDPLFRVAAIPGVDGTSRLVLVGHQAVVDRASLMVVAEELVADLSGTPMEDTPSGYLAWWRDRDDRRAADDLAALAERLRGETEPLVLPERRPRAAVHVYDEASVPVVLEPDLDLAAVADRHGVGVEALLLAGLRILLSWYTGQWELPIGTVRDPREDADARIVGPLAGLVPMRLRGGPEQSFRTVLADSAAELAFADRHCHAPFDELVRVLDPPKDMSRTALFDVLFHYAEDPVLGSPDGPTIEVCDPVSGHGKYDLHLSLRPYGRGFHGRLVYNARYFDEDQMHSMAEHYVRLVERAAHEPETPAGAFEPLTADERHTRLVTWNSTEAGYPETTLPALVRAQAVARPDAVALVDGNRRRTYRELVARAEELARGLVASGVRPGELVALVLERGAEQVEAMLAVLFAGAAYLPIDPASPPERSSFVLADSGARFAITDGAREVGTSSTVLTLDEAAGHSETDVTLPSVEPTAPAYCIYTSGTSGRPKGVVIGHRNVVRLVVNDRAPFAFGPDDVWTMFHSYAFDFSVWEVFGCLAHGGRLVVVPQDTARDAQRFWRLLQHERVTVVNQTPSAFAQLAEAAAADPAPLERLRYLIFGGERLQPRTLAEWTRRRPHVNVVNMYGITETTVHVTVRPVTRDDIEGDVSNIGGPIPTTTVHLLDPGSGARLLPVGAVGEIHVGGPGVAEGYLGRPDLDAERFVDDPFGSGTMFRTGDLARRRPDGTLEYIGRRDSQVKLRGYRIELEEVASCLREHPDIAEAAVLVEGGADGALAAYLRPRAQPPTVAGLRAHLGRLLPTYMIPSAFHIVERVPLTGNGKLDARALRALATPLRRTGGRRLATPTAETLAEIFAELFATAVTDADASFFELGGHSLLATRLVTRIVERLGVEPTLRDVFEHPRLRDLADHLDTLPAWGREEAAGPAAEESETSVPASSFQERIWFAERLEPDVVSYNVPLAWRVRGRLDGDALRRALATLVERHEILRTRFVERAGRLRQVVDEPWVPEVGRRDLGGLTEPQRRREVRRRLGVAANERFDPASGRLLRVELLDFGGPDQALVLATHHLVWDGASTAVFLRDLERCHAAVPSAPPPVPAFQYGDFVRARMSERDGELGRAGIEYWAEQLSDAPSHLPLPPPASPEPHGAVSVPLGSDLPERLRELRAEHGVSPFTVVAAALAVVLHRWTGRDDVTFGCPVAGRDDEDTADLLGPCLNTAVLRSRCADGTSVGDLLRAMRDRMLDMLEYQNVPFEVVLERLRPPRRPGRTPYADVTLNMVTTSGDTATLGEATLAPVPFDQWERETKFGLTATFSETDGGMSGVLSYRGDRFARADVERMARGLGWLLDRFPESMDRPPHALDGLPVGDDSPARPQYRDFAAARAARRDDGSGAAALEHWVDRLAGAPSSSALTPPGSPEAHGEVPVPLPDDVLDGLRGLRSEHGVSWFMVTAAALAGLLHRWTGQDDLTFGVPISTRADDFADVLGPCLNTVALRSQHEERASVRDLLHAMRDTVLDAFDHRDVPFEAVVDRLNPPRHPGRTPYLDVALVADVEPAGSPTLGGATLESMRLDHDGAGYVAKFGLTVAFVETRGRLNATILYRGDRIARADVERMALLLGRLLGGFPDLLDRPLDTLDLLDDAERAEVARFESGAPAPVTASVPEMVARRCARRPDAPAVVTTRGSLSYRDLDRRARALAARLRPTARGDDPVVALSLPRGADLVVAALAVWQAGCAFCPLDPAYPRERVDHILDELDACAVLTDDGELAEHLAAREIPIIDPGADAGETDDTELVAADTRPDGDATAYVLYTSGTTGHPKGVTYSHASLAAITSWHIDEFGVAPEDRVSQLHSVAFDMTQWELWSTLCAGATVLPYEPAVVVPELVEWLADRRVSVLFAPTPLAEALWSTGAPLSSLRWMFFAGSALTRSPPDDRGYRVCNAYGPTESFITTVRVIEPGSTAPPNCIGRPIAGGRVHVLDPAGRRRPVGAPGEIHVGGVGVARGYRRRPELTRERFSAVDPDGEPGRVYRTGDRGRWLPDGTLEFLGRMDRQLKIRGYRVEPQEVETHLRADPSVLRAVVTAVERSSLIGYLVPRGEGRPDGSAVLGRLRARLPDFMVPDALVWLDELPVNARGKVDFARLPRPTRDDLAGRAPRAEPADDLERRIAKVWSGVLGVDSVGVHDNFFDLGGNSLALATLHARLQAELEELPIRHLFEFPTVRALARALTAQERGPDEDDPRERARRARRARSARSPRRPPKP